MTLTTAHITVNWMPGGIDNPIAVQPILEDVTDHPLCKETPRYFQWKYLKNHSVVQISENMLEFHYHPFGVASFLTADLVYWIHNTVRSPFYFLYSKELYLWGLYFEDPVEAEQFEVNLTFYGLSS